MGKGSNDIPLNHALLKWAREEAGLSIDAAAGRAKITALQPRKNFMGATPGERLQSWESGEITPSFNQLKKIAKAYQRPVLTFFLPSPPRSESSLADFRTVGDRLPGTKDSPEFSALIRRIEALDQTLKDILVDSNTPPVQFVGKGDINDTIEKTVANIRKQLTFSFEDQTRISNKDLLFKTLRQKAQNLGIFVILEGDLGSYHTAIPPSDYRGLAISDNVAPMVIVNPNDSKAAKIFTLVHELVHLWIGDSGISNLYALSDNHSEHQRNEKFCNKVAAEFLIPEFFLKQIWRVVSVENDLSRNINNAANRFKVSNICLARRLLDLDFISNDTYRSIYRQYQKHLKHIVNKMQENEGGPNHIVVRKYRLGEHLINTVINAANDGRISEIDASQILRVKINKFSEIFGSAA